MTFNFPPPTNTAPVAQPQFSMPAPVGLPPVAQVQQGFAPPAAQVNYNDPFAALANAETWESGKPKLPVWGEPYTCRIDRCIFDQKNQAFIAEFTITHTTNPNVTVGTQGSYYQQLNKVGVNYLANWLCAVMGYDRADKATLASIMQALPAIARAATTGQAQQTQWGNLGPELVIGKEALLLVAPPKDGSTPDRKGRLYNQENWFRKAA